MLPDGGYGALLHKLAAGIEVRYHSPVVAIESRDDGSAGSAGELIRVVTMDEVQKGTRLEHEERRLLASPASLTPLLPPQVHKAEAVIVTVPLGVLKRTPDEGGIRFEPPLPPAHLSAISRLGFGLLNKVALFFPKVFWPHQTDFFGRTARDPKQRGRFFLFFNLHQSSGQPALLALIAGSAAQDLEKLDDDDVANEALEALRTMFGKVRRDGTRLGTAHGLVAHPARASPLYTGAEAEEGDRHAVGRRRVRVRLVLAHPGRRLRPRLPHARAARQPPPLLCRRAHDRGAPGDGGGRPPLGPPRRPQGAQAVPDDAEPGQRRVARRRRRVVVGQRRRPHAPLSERAGSARGEEYVCACVA